MNTDNLYYTDGQYVSVSPSGIKVRKQHYQLEGITRHGISIIAPPRVPFASLVIIGAALFVYGVAGLAPASLKTIDLFGSAIPSNTLFMTGGVVLLVSGFLMMLTGKEKYAVRIFTPRGEKDIVISPNREYVNQIVDALNRAFLDAGEKRMKKKAS